MIMKRHSRPGTVALAAVLALGSGLAARPAFAVNKDMVELQTQVQNLQDSVARLQQSNDERMGVLKDLVQQSADTVNKLSLAVDSLQKGMHTQADTTGGKVDQVSGQVGALNDSVDEIKTRMNRIEKALQDLQAQQQSINAALQNMSPAGGTNTGITSAPGSTPMPSAGPIDQPAPSSLSPTQPTKGHGKPSAGTPLSALANPGPTVPPPPASPAAPGASDLYKTALGDYMSAKYPLATSEFSEIIRLYPDDALSGNAFYYLGEIDYRSGKYANSVRNYDHVLEQFPDNSKVPVSHLHKGMALFALKENEAGSRELRALITRFPNSPEATQARSKLNGMGIAISPRR
jgi:tol-pal system protein YbgF